MMISSELSSRWQLLAEDLKVDRKDIFKIAETSFKPEDKCHQMLLIWQASLPAGHDAKKELIQALEKCDRHDLVVNVLGPRAGMHLFLFSFFFLHNHSYRAIPRFKYHLSVISISRCPCKKL